MSNIVVLLNFFFLWNFPKNGWTFGLPQTQHLFSKYSYNLVPRER